MNTVKGVISASALKSLVDTKGITEAAKATLDEGVELGLTVERLKDGSLQSVRYRVKHDDDTEKPDIEALERAIKAYESAEGADDVSMREKIAAETKQERDFLKKVAKKFRALEERVEALEQKK